MQGASKTVQTSRQRQERRAQSAADQVSRMGADVASLVVRVDGQVQAHQLDEVLVAPEAELVGQVESIVLVLLDSGNLAILEDIAVDAGGDGGELGDEIHGVLKGVLPVLLLVNALRIGLRECRFVLKSSHGQGELGHGVKVIGAAVDELLDELGDIGASSPLGRQVTNLLLAGNFTSQEQPEETFSFIVSSMSRDLIIQTHLPSGRGSSPPGALGSCSWHSGI